MASQGDPGVYRRKLRMELRRARDATSMTQREAAAALDWSLSKVIRIEAGVNSVSVTDLRALLQLYKVTEESVIEALTEAARAGRAPAWWSRYRAAVTPQLAQYLADEGSASSIRVFHPYVVPGLLQTEDYARELLAAYTPHELTSLLVEMRMERQEIIFDQSKPPEMEFIFGEEALHRLIGGHQVMRKQLVHLLEVSSRDFVSVGIVPNSVGAHPGLRGPFILLGFNDSGDELVFVEGASSDMVTRDDKDLVVQLIENFETLGRIALQGNRAADLLKALIGGLSTGASTK